MLQESKFSTGERQQEILPVKRNTQPFLCTVTHLDNNPDKPIPWHWHRLFEIDYIKEGELSFQTPDSTHILSRGEAIFVNYSTLHTCTAIGSSPCEYYTVHFDMHFLSGVYNSVFEEKYFLPVMRNSALQVREIKPDSLPHLRMLESVLRIVEICSDEPFGYEFDVRNRLSSFWKLLLEDTKDVPRTAPSANAVDTERIKIMTDFIQKHCGEKITLEDIASSAGISTRECTRCFSRCISTSPNAYLNQTRLAKAVGLLSESTKSIIEISEECGFSSPSYFGRVFREAMGCTPGEYREKDAGGTQPWYYSTQFSSIARK